MPALKVGESFPDGVVLSYVPYAPETSSLTACGGPVNYDASKEFADKKAVLISVPGAFTPTCHVRHIPAFIERVQEFKNKGVDVICVIAYNDAFVMSAWGKVNGVQDNSVLFLSDPEAQFSKSIGWMRNQERTGRYAVIVDHGKVVYAENEAGGDVTVSGAEAVLAKLLALEIGMVKLGRE